MGCSIPGLRQQHRAVCDQQRQDFGRTEFRFGQSKWLHDVRRIRVWLELEQLRPFLGQQRLRNVQAIGRLQRNVDGIETIEPQIVLEVDRVETVTFMPVF